ncbi:MAG TPA: ABC transporter substrate-binding protein [Thermodesulfobacteriota bacterium]|nr:ABC transporter substrate-binding protein [Thermodesulfobacteriota bacterium]
MPIGRGFFVIFLSAWLLNAATVIGADKIYINGIDSHFPPFTYIDRDGNPKGFDVEALDWIAREIGFQIQHRPKEWSGIEDSLETHEIDLIASGLVAGENRSLKMAFTIPYLTISQVTLTRSVSHLDINDIILSQEIGTLSGAFKVQWFKGHGMRDGWDYHIRLEDSAPPTLSDRYSNPVGVAKGPLAMTARTSVTLEEGFVFGVRKENAELLAILNEGLRKLMASPFWLELIRKYIGGVKDG